MYAQYDEMRKGNREKRERSPAPADPQGMSQKCPRAGGGGLMDTMKRPLKWMMSNRTVGKGEKQKQVQVLTRENCPGLRIVQHGDIQVLTEATGGDDEASSGVPLDLITHVNGIHVRPLPLESVKLMLEGIADGQKVELTLAEPLPNDNGDAMPTNGHGVQEAKCPINGEKTPDVLSARGGRGSAAGESVSLTYLANGTKFEDRLHNKAVVARCTDRKCTGSMMRQDEIPKVTSKEILIQEATDFIRQYYESVKDLNTPAHKARLAEVLASIEKTGTYDLTTPELTFGAKTAWRNASRCIGRIQWSKLQVFDARHVCTAKEMFDAICVHMKYANNKGHSKGNIRSALTVFPARTDGQHDFRVWNAQMIMYAGYIDPDDPDRVIGDRGSVRFTEVCIDLGWKPKYGRFDVLPLVLQANGEPPEVFEIPQELVLEVELTHPTYDWFAELGLKWFCVPGVSALKLDCGGLEFPGIPFNGWYMGTEIGARNMCDPYRYDMCETIAKKMGCDTSSEKSLWRDQACLVANVAVLHSFALAKVVIVDHYTASYSFMRHHENEQKERGGCPADWVWVVPPMSGSLCPVFHLEMLDYKLKPSYEYQNQPAHTYVLKKDRKQNGDDSKKSLLRKVTLRQAARAVMMTNTLMGKALAKRVKCKILFATETGTSKDFADKLADLFKYAFDVKVYNMKDYNPWEMEHEQLVVVVAATAGNGDPPDCAIEFSEKLAGMVPQGRSSVVSTHDDILQRRKASMDMSATPLGSTNRRLSSSVGDAVGWRQQETAFQSVAIKENEEMTSPQPRLGTSQSSYSRGWSSLSLLPPGTPEDDNPALPLSNVSYTVFALGSSDYPNYCAFGRYMDTLLQDLGAQSIHPLGEGDERCHQESTFLKWSQEVFKAACSTFCEEVDMDLQDMSLRNSDHSWESGRFRLVTVSDKEPDLCEGLTMVQKRPVVASQLVAREQLQAEQSPRQTIKVSLAADQPADFTYLPGDHVGLYPPNPPELVKRVIKRLDAAQDLNQVVTLEMRTEEMDDKGGVTSVWVTDKRLSLPLSLQRALTHYLDITSTPNQDFLSYLAALATDPEEIAQLKALADLESNAYESWKKKTAASLPDVLESFPSVPPVCPTLLLSQLPLMLQRFYSISSAIEQPGTMDLTVAVCMYETKDGKHHEGVCSNWLNRLDQGALVPASVKSAPSFHMPKDPKAPIIMVGAGTGIAPLRGFWEQRTMDRKHGEKSFGPMELFFGCRQSTLDFIYESEMKQCVADGVLDQLHLALSREPGQEKAYVQHRMASAGKSVVNMLMEDGGHLYVCGEVNMAHQVGETLEAMLKEHAGMTQLQAAEFVFNLRKENRYHEDIFGGAKE